MNHCSLLSAVVSAPHMGRMKRTIAVMGHYGSGKTEFAVNYSIYLKNKGHDVTLLDMDIANPYFRSRERQKVLEDKGALFHLKAIEEELALPVTGIINNTHMLAETRPEDVIKGHRLCMKVSEETGIPVILDVCLRKFEDDLKGTGYDLFPIDLYMRPSWLDARV